MRNPYESLAVPRTATADDVKKSFRELAKKLHPDTNKNDPRATALFAEVNAAHEILGDEVKRRAFDRGEIDAEGKPNHQARSRRDRMWYVATCLMIVLTLAVTSTELIVWLTPPSKVNAISDQQRGAQQDETSVGRATTVTPTGRDAIRTPVEPQLDHRQIGLLVARSWKLMSEGKVEAARNLLERAATSRDPRAALALGSTYDPIMLEILEVRGVAADAFLARLWYRRAITFGSEEAKKPAASDGRRPPRRSASQSAQNPREDIIMRRALNIL
jgi:DnaJ-like protein